MRSSGPIPLLPKPPTARDGSGNKGNVPRKASTSTFMFVNFADPEKEGKTQLNRQKVKKWAMLNRKTHMYQPSSNQSQGKLLTWDSVDHSSRESSESVESSSLSATSRAGNLSGRILSSAPLDPFGTLPIKSNYATSETLWWFLSGGHIFDDVARTRASSIRKSLTFPAVVSSKAAFSNMMALLEISPFGPSRGQNKTLIRSHLSNGLTATNKLLVPQKAPPDESVFMCVSFLMWIAHYLRDPQAVETHFSGYTALAAHNWDLFARTPRFQNGPLFWDFTLNENANGSARTPFNEGCLRPDFNEPSPDRMDPDLVLTDPWPYGNGFQELFEAGLVTQELYEYVPQLLCMDVLLHKAKTSHLTTDESSDLIKYILYNARQLKRLDRQSVTTLEHSIQQCLTIYYYSDIYQDPARGVGWLAKPMQGVLSTIDTTSLLETHPELLLWICLVAGPFTSGLARAWFCQLLTSARNMLLCDNFQEAISMHLERFIWTRMQDVMAEQLWDESSINAYSSDYTESRAFTPEEEEFWMIQSSSRIFELAT